ncbi:MAG: ROK family protein [Candidatus Delongbacteria bacterium]|jgi:glucokinase|nr:ROK family protein [Candidatus Delongbacteria bacterium]
MKHKAPLILSLDAGGTNFVFYAVKGNKIIGEPIQKPSYANNLNKSLQTIVEGFETLAEQQPEPVAALSFAFPGPADYENGIIGDLGNLPAYRDGVALGPLLEEKFGIPVFINNDADLFAYGESICGCLPDLNNKLKATGSRKTYRNLVGLTLGTGFGLGVVNEGHLLRGDNSMPNEIWLMRNPEYPDANIEESISIRGIQRSYRKLSGDKEFLTPKDIYEQAVHGIGKKQQAALETYRIFGYNLGDTIATLISLYDSNVVIGGGIAKAWDLFMPALIKQLNSEFITPEGKHMPRLTHQVYALEDESNFKAFASGGEKQVALPGKTEALYRYNHNPRVGIMKSALGTSQAVVTGAYHFALTKLV